jgi:alpha-L-fucosidase
VPDVSIHPSPMVETLRHHRDRWAHVEHFDDFLPFLTFDQFDPDAWAGLARDAGMGYAVMVAKHHDGLCWWDAPATNRTVLVDGPSRNVLGEFAAACERADLVFGTSYSLLDWGDERYPGVDYVNDVLHPHVLDLVERYGSQMLWGDGHWGAGGSHWRSDDLIAAARAINPDLVVNDRWWADERGVVTFENRTPDTILTRPWETRRGLGSSLGLNRSEPTDNILAADEIIALLTEVVAKGGHLLLSVAPDANGFMPSRYTDPLRAAGSWVRQHRDLIDHGTPWTIWGDEDVRYLVLGGELHAIDVTGRCEFSALGRNDHQVRSVTAFGNEEPLDFNQNEDSLRLVGRAPRQPLSVYRFQIDEPEPRPVQLFPVIESTVLRLDEVIGVARPGEIIQLGEGTYVGPAHVPDGVTVRGLGPARTVVDGLDTYAVTLGAASRIEHCMLRGNGRRIAWLPKTVVRLLGDHACVLGCSIDGHLEPVGDEARITSCTAVGVTSDGADRISIARSTFTGMNWDCGIDLNGGTGHTIESCEFNQCLTSIQLTKTTGAMVRGNRIAGRWWGVHLIETEGTVVVGNAIEKTMRAIDVDGGTLAQVGGNAVTDGDSGCIVQRGATETEISGNRWERCRIGVLAWDAGLVRQGDNSAVDLIESDGAFASGP